MLGGTLSVESEVGKGSCFHFTLRAGLVACENEGSAQGPPEPLTSNFAQKNADGLQILLAEDNAVNQKVAISLLRKQGQSVTLACMGSRVLELLEHQTFDLILMDVQIPEMDGLEATAVIRLNERDSEKRTPIIALTAHAMTGDREICMAAEMDGYVSKPIIADDLNNEIERLRVERLTGNQLVRR